MECEPLSSPKKKYQRNALELPPCFVCGGTASGVHYGVNTCTGCKMFFQRYLKRDSPFVCKMSGNCKIIDSNRGNCSACRANKCLSVGMAREGIRMGRYTSTERSIKIKEVNRLKASRNHNKEVEGADIRNDTEALLSRLHDETNIDDEMVCIGNKIDVGYISESSPSDITSNTLTSQIDQENRPVLAETVENNVDMVDKRSFCMLTDAVMKALEKMTISPEDVHEEISPKGTSEKSCINQTSSSSFSSHHSENLSNQQTRIPDSPDSSSSTDSGIVEPEHQFPLDELTILYLAMTAAPHLSDEEIKKILKEGSDRYQDQVRLFGSLNPLSFEEYKTVRKETGLDIDGREAMIQKCQHHEVELYAKYVKFVHMIPGFKDLPAKDQIVLMKASFCDLDVFLSYRYCDFDLEMLMWPNPESVYHIHQLCIFQSLELCRTFFEVSKNVKSLNLSFEEAALCTAISVTFRDRCKLQEPDKVEKIQWKLIETLQESLKSRLNDTSKTQKTFSKIMDVFVHCRGIYDKSRKNWVELSKDEYILELIPNFSTYFNFE